MCVCVCARSALGVLGFATLTAIVANDNNHLKQHLELYSEIHGISLVRRNNVIDRLLFAFGSE